MSVRDEVELEVSELSLQKAYLVMVRSLPFFSVMLLLGGVAVYPMWSDAPTSKTPVLWIILFVLFVDAYFRWCESDGKDDERVCP